MEYNSEKLDLLLDQQQVLRYSSERNRHVALSRERICSTYVNFSRVTTSTINYYGFHQHVYRQYGSCHKFFDSDARLSCQTTQLLVLFVLFYLMSDFNKIRHDLLLKRIVDCFLGLMLIRWCSDYLKDRTLKVKYNKITIRICHWFISHCFIYGQFTLTCPCHNLYK